LNDTTIRISSVKYDEDQNTYLKKWSTIHGGRKGELSEEEVAGVHSRLPIMKDNEFMTFIETWVDSTPMFDIDIGIAPHDVANFVFIRPRYAPRVCRDECN
jgi:hypothetical protein